MILHFCKWAKCFCPNRFLHVLPWFRTTGTNIIFYNTLSTNFFRLIIHVKKMNSRMPGTYFMYIFCICSIIWGYNIKQMSEILILKFRRKLRGRVILSNKMLSFYLICLFHCSTVPYIYGHCEDLHCGMSCVFPSLIIYLASSK